MELAHGTVVEPKAHVRPGGAAQCAYTELNEYVESRISVQWIRKGP
jgi:hypothetical protein